VGEELQDLGVQDQVELLLIGGGFMLTQIQNRTATSDIDVLVIKPDAYSEPYRRLKAAARFVAYDEKLNPAWFSTNIGDFLTIAGPLPPLTLWQQFGPLFVYIPPKGYILAHKFLASRDKDQDDIKILCQQLHILTRQDAQNIVDAYIDTEIQCFCGIAQKLDEFFSVDIPYPSTVSYNGKKIVHSTERTTHYATRPSTNYEQFVPGNMPG
jgi:hypothetical protein